MAERRRENRGASPKRRAPRKWIDWRTAATILVPLRRPVCPKCGTLGQNRDRQRSEAGGDGSITRRMICGHCGTAYQIAWELAEPGNAGLVILPPETGPHSEHPAIDG